MLSALRERFVLELSLVLQPLLVCKLFDAVVLLCHPWIASESRVRASLSNLERVRQEVPWSDDNLAIFVPEVLLLVIKIGLMVIGCLDGLLHNLGWAEGLIVSGFDMPLGVCVAHL